MKMNIKMSTITVVIFFSLTLFGISAYLLRFDYTSISDADTSLKAQKYRRYSSDIEKYAGTGSTCDCGSNDYTSPQITKHLSVLHI